MLRQPYLISVTTLPYKSNLPIPRNIEYNIWDPWIPQQSPETSKYTLNAVAFSLAWFLMVEIMLQELQFIPLPTPPQMSYLTHP